MLRVRSRNGIRDYTGICRDCGAEWNLPEEWVLEVVTTRKSRSSRRAERREARQVCCPACGSAEAEVRETKAS